MSQRFWPLSPAKGSISRSGARSATQKNTARLNPDAILLPERQELGEVATNPALRDRVIDNHGYALDLAGDPLIVPVQVTEFDRDTGDKVTKTVEMRQPGHFSRRCTGTIMKGPLKELERCGFMWESKICPHCGAKNDISARKCPKCSAKFVDPNKKLSDEAAREDTSGPHDVKECNVLSVGYKTSWTSQGDPLLRVIYQTDHPQKQYQELSDVYNPPSAEYPQGNAKWLNLCKKSFNTTTALSMMEVLTRHREGKPPASLTFQKKAGDKYPRILRKTWSE